MAFLVWTYSTSVYEKKGSKETDSFLSPTDMRFMSRRSAREGLLSVVPRSADGRISTWGNSGRKLKTALVP